jgi:hypothetical protein
MSTNNKKKCCEGCKKGQPGTNKACQAKLMAEKLTKHVETIKTI